MTVYVNPYRFAPAGFSPGDLGSVIRAWYKMDLLAGSNGDPISSIADSSGNGFTLTQAGTLRGTLAAANQNGLNTLRLTQSASQRYILSNSIFGSSAAASAYIVYKVVSVAVNNGLWVIGQAGNDSMPFSNGLYYDDFASTTRKDGMAPTASPATAYRILSFYSAANDWAWYMDGGTGGSSGGLLPVFQTSTNTVGFNGATQLLGSNASFVTLDGWIAEAIFTNAKQSSTDQRKMEGSLAWKWGATGNLAATHPYKTSPP